MLYKISNLVCAYKQTGKKVLEVQHLDIPKRKIIVILGLSGIGKSTLLETLGLMNNTIVGQKHTLFHFFGNGVPLELDFSNIWHNHSDSYLSTLRNQHFSFIFQDTNLMPNFSAMENIMLTLMLQGHSNKEARIRGHSYLQKVGMGDIDPEKKVFELSGGQRQRIAFIRAICPDFTVLLGDEPTGNLDRFTSRKLMQILRSSIHEKERSAII
ncbi:MAG: ATP-binding cassette domain-containing protein, partial [Bacteroidales bacterium]